MNKTLLCAVFLPLVLNAQEDYRSRVGINTTTPQATLEISRKELNTLPNGYAQGVLFPEFTTEERLTFSSNAKKGTLIYNKDKNCIEMYRGLINGVHEWTCTNANAGSPISNPSATATAILGAVQDIKLVVFKHNGKNYLVQGNKILEGGIANDEEVIVEIPYSNAQPNNGDYTAYEQTLALKNGIGYMQDFKLSYPAGSFTGDTGTIQAKLKNVSGAIYYPALAPEDGTHHNAISNANAYTISLNGSSTTTLKVKTITGIPDRCFDKTTLECVGYGASEKEHNFVYLPITGPDGKTWLNNNLGADYAKVGSPWFDLTYQAGALDYLNTNTAVVLDTPTADQIKKDWRAYGSLFQWQRNPDGHELINWYNTTSGEPKYGTTLSDSWTNAGTNKFIYNNSLPYPWVNNTLNDASTNKNLWQSGQSNNPCPVGYHVPTHTEQMALHNAILGYDAGTSSTNSNKMWNETGLRLPVSGYRGTINAMLSNQSNIGNLWSSDQSNSSTSWDLWFYSGNSTVGYSYGRANGFSVRCLKD
ncbi:hypothetical protein D1J36_002480 [Riemerella anatipestifer]|uniref:FISUMP domain-containing protein n=1 Tax=Riemerella anatipestifer TaxID=34085 RepID=UPI0012AE18BB|nr:FISUMP domain-containing protein [Riemerella anatipestifer]USL95995.1 hypothetical protein D1J36_002480 [Riemerella anatipestifer]